jgi:hypothetical protein
MARLRSVNLKNRVSSSGSFRLVLPRRHRNLVALGKRGRGNAKQLRNSCIPPEDWHEPTGDTSRGYKIIEQEPGQGYVHVVTPQQIRERLALLPDHLTSTLEVVQLSRMTRKKRSFPCYGMQWGTAIYLYPVEATLTEYYSSPPRPAVYNEARQFGGVWESIGGGAWKLLWSREALENFYLNNVLIHELGHVLDLRNSSYRDRERFAEWFAIEYGYKPSRRMRSSAPASSIARGIPVPAPQ